MEGGHDWKKSSPREGERLPGFGRRTTAVGGLRGGGKRNDVSGEKEGGKLPCRPPCKYCVCIENGKRNFGGGRERGLRLWRRGGGEKKSFNLSFKIDNVDNLTFSQKKGRGKDG